VISRIAWSRGVTSPSNFRAVSSLNGGPMARCGAVRAAAPSMSRS
jgi:hypothetical protein